MDNCLELRIAQDHLRGFQGTSHDDVDDVISRHLEAMECCDCEEKIQRGIDTREWLLRCEETVREAAYRNLINPPEEIWDSLKTLYVAWLHTFEYVSRQIARHEANGYTVTGAQKLNECAELVKEWIDQHEWKRCGQQGIQDLDQEPW